MAWEGKGLQRETGKIEEEGRGKAKDTKEDGSVSGEDWKAGDQGGSKKEKKQKQRIELGCYNVQNNRQVARKRPERSIKRPIDRDHYPL